MSENDFRANDNEPPSRLDDLVAVTIEDFVIRAEQDFEGGEESVAAGPALVELAAAAVADVVLAYEMDPQRVMKLVASRVSARCMAEVKRSELLDRPRLAVVQERSGRRSTIACPALRTHELWGVFGLGDGLEG
jgi:hypothetical protein